MQFTGLLFGPGFPPAGHSVSFNCAAEQLQTSTGIAVPLSAIDLRTVGFDAQGIEFSWNDERGAAWAIHVLDKAQARELLERLPPPLQAQAKHLRRRRPKFGLRALGWTALASFIAAPLLVLLFVVVFADNLAGWATQFISVEQETRLGNASFNHMKAGLQLRDDSAAAAAVRDIGARLTQGSRYTYRFHVVEDDAINAFAIPGGIVVVHSGLIAATKRPEELAGVLAHEVQHVELRHSLKRITKQIGLAAWTLVTGDLTGGVGAEAARQLVELKFSRDAEREADERGVQALVSANIDPAGMPAFFSTLATNSTSVPALLSTHPQSTDRQAALTGMIAALPSREYSPLAAHSWPPAVR